MARSETIALFRALAREGLHIVISSHILHEVDRISDQVVLLSNGYVVAEGQIQAVRGEMHQEHPLQVLVRCTQPGLLAARLFAQDHVVEVKMHNDRQGLLVSTAIRTVLRAAQPDGDRGRRRAFLGRPGRRRRPLGLTNT